MFISGIYLSTLNTYPRLPHLVTLVGRKKEEEKKEKFVPREFSLSPPTWNKNICNFHFYYSDLSYCFYTRNPTKVLHTDKKEVRSQKTVKEPCIDRTLNSLPITSRFTSWLSSSPWSLLDSWKFYNLLPSSLFYSFSSRLTHEHFL